MLRQLERSTIHLLAKRGKSQRQIAHELELSRATVSRALREPVDKKPAKRRRPSSVDPFAGQIRQWISQNLSAVRMLEMARADPDHPYPGGRSVFGQYVRKIRLECEHSLADVPVRFEGLPGEYLQVDWGEVRHFPFTRQKSATRYFLACRLKYSRWSFVRWTTRMDQETLLRLLVDCFLALGFVPWVLVFDNIKTVTLGRDPQDQPLWHPVFLQFAHEFDFHPEACAIRAANQKGSVESLVKWVKGNFLPGRSFLDDTDLAQQSVEWLHSANSRPSSATGEPPLQRLQVERAKGSSLPASATDYGFPQSAQVNSEAMVHVLGNAYSVPVVQVGAAVTVRLHRERIVIWRDTERIAEHKRAADGAHQRVVIPQHFEPLFLKKPRAQVMLQRQALLELGEVASSYVSQLSRRCRDRLAREIVAIYALGERCGREALLEAMEKAERVGIYGADYLTLLLEPPMSENSSSPLLPDVPSQMEVDRLLSSYEEWVVGASSEPERAGVVG
jgi:transposase